MLADSERAPLQLVETRGCRADVRPIQIGGEMRTSTQPMGYSASTCLPHAYVKTAQMPASGTPSRSNGRSRAVQGIAQ